MLSVFFSLITLALATVPRRLECNSPHPSDELMTLHSHLATAQLIRRETFPESVVINTYVHIFAENTTYAGGWLSNTTIEKQIQVLNQGFNSTPFHFSLAGISRNVTRLPPATDQSTDAKVAFWLKHRQGNYRSLNLYYVSGYYGGLATFPSLQAALEMSVDMFMDGCIMGADTTPGSAGLFGAGTTTIHEVGHWMGLLHTFHGGCSHEYGDFVDDTPFEDDAPSKRDPQTFEECPVGRNSCPDLPGLDPIHNYMDYTSEDCRSEFTPGQIDRMKSIWALSPIRFLLAVASPFLDAQGNTIPKEQILGSGGRAVVIVQNDVAVKIPLRCPWSTAYDVQANIDSIRPEQNAYRRLQQPPDDARSSGVVRCVGLALEVTQLAYMANGDLKTHLATTRPSGRDAALR